MAKKSEKAKMSPEWSYLVEAEKVLQGTPYKVSITANQEAREALARRLKIMSVSELTVDATLERVRGGAVIHVKGLVQADLTQECVVTLEPVNEAIDESFEGWFADPETPSFTKARRERDTKHLRGEKPMLEEDEDPEAIEDGEIDVAELAVQYLSLTLNPYPHAEGVSVEDIQNSQSKDDEGARDTFKNPFAALKDWKNRQR